MHPVAVITGTTHGIGRVTARELVRGGYAVTMLCRDVMAGRRVREDILARVPQGTIDVVHCDLAALASVRECARQLLGAAPRIDLLVNNAGITALRRRLSPDGFELTFATNQLGPFLLTELLRPRMPPGARIVNVASCAHARGRLDLASVPAPARPYRPTRAYARSKLANVCWTLALARRTASSGITVNCLHPGIVASHLLPWWVRLVKPLVTRETFDVERGAATMMYLAMATEAARLHGCYVDEYQRVVEPSAAARDVGAQEALWQACARWAGLGG